MQIFGNIVSNASTYSIYSYIYHIVSSTIVIILSNAAPILLK